MGNNTIYSPFHSERGRGWGFLSRDRRWHLSLLCGILLDRKNHSNRLQLGAPPLGGGWVGFPDEGVCPYRLACSLNKGTPSFNWKGRFLAMKRASLHIEETPSLFANNAIYSPLHSERGGGEAPSFPLGEAGWGFHPRVSVPTVWHVLLFSLAASTLSSAPLAHYWSRRLYRERIVCSTTGKRVLDTAYTPFRKWLIVYHPRQKLWK